MSIDWTSSLGAVVAFAGWTLWHTFVMLAHRNVEIAAGRATPTGWVPSRHESQGSWYGRVCASHANCVENLVVFAALVISLHLMGTVDSRTDAPWAWRYVYLRVVQSVAHWMGTGEGPVTIRFLAFVGQLVCLGVLVYRNI